MPIFDERVPSDYRLRNAIEEIQLTYGVHVRPKNKRLWKLGRYADLGTSRATVQTQGGFEVYQTENTITHVSSSSASDTMAVLIEGHTIDGNGDFTFVTQMVTLTGQTAAALPTPLARATRAYVIGTTNLVGNMYVHRNAALTAGVPDDMSLTHLMISASAASQGPNISKKGSTTLSKEDYWVILGVTGSLLLKQAGFANFTLQTRFKGQVFADLISFGVTDTESPPFDTPFIIPANADVRMVATGSTTGMEVTCAMFGYLLVEYDRV